MKRRIVWLLLAGLAVVSLCSPSRAETKVLRAGIVGCDTSHVPAFTQMINSEAAEGPFAQVEVTVAYPGGSPDIPSSIERIPGYVDDLRKQNVKIVDSLEQLAAESDVVLIESVDGRPKLEQFRAVAKGKPVYIDKPLAASLSDVIQIFRHAEATKTPVFTSSSLRYLGDVENIAKDASLGQFMGCETTGPLKLEPHHPDLYWYGIHGCELLYAAMGVGCETVARTDTDISSVVVGKWKDGRIGSFRGIKAGGGYYAITAYGAKNSIHRGGLSGYEPLVRSICEFFVSGNPPVSSQETIELFAFMQAADESKKAGGKPVAIADVIRQAEQEAAAKN